MDFLSSPQDLYSPFCLFLRVFNSEFPIQDLIFPLIVNGNGISIYQNLSGISIYQNQVLKIENVAIVSWLVNPI